MDEESVDGVVRSAAVLVGDAKNLTVRETRWGEVLVVDVNGRVNGANSDEFQRVLNEMVMADDCRVVLDFGDLAYISSAGLRVVLLMARMFGKLDDGRFGICGVRGVVQEVFSMSGLDKVISIYGDSREAVASVSKPAVGGDG